MKTIRTYYELQYFSDSDMIWKPFGDIHDSADSAESELNKAIRFHTEIYNLETEYRIVKKTLYSEVFKEF